MGHNHVAIEIIAEVGCKAFGTIYRAMLAAGTAEGDLEVRKLALYVFFYRLGDYRLHMFEEPVDGGLFLQKLYDRRVFACIASIFGIAAWIGQRATVEDESSSVARSVVGEPFLEGEAEDVDGEGV